MSLAKEIIRDSRPKQVQGRGDKYLGDAADELARHLRKCAHGFTGPNCRLADQLWGFVSPTVIEWAEDIHNGLGLWRGIEQHQQQTLRTPLPLVVAPDETVALEGFDARRIRFLLWNLWPHFAATQVLSPADPDLIRLSEFCAQFLSERFALLPKDSGSGRLMTEPVEFGWDVKRKLVWLSCHSYLLRWEFLRRMKGASGEGEIMKADEFMSNHCSAWSGLGAVDILAGALPALTETDRSDLKAWSQRHMSMYRIVDMDQSAGYVRRVFARNLVNNESYTIRVERGLHECPFLPGRTVFGWLVPWRGEWYWSGQQRVQDETPESEDAKLRQEIIIALGQFVYRYCPAELAKAEEVARKMHEEFVALHGSDLAVFPDGRAAEAAEGTRLERWRNAHAELFGLPPGPGERLNFPSAFLESSHGVAAYSLPVDGAEYAREFSLIQSGLAKRGAGMSAEEADAVRGLIRAPEISPEFVRRLTADSGPASIGEAFGIHDYPLETMLEFLLRRHKGKYYRRRYPNLLPYRE